MTEQQTLEFHMLNFFKVKGDYASTMEMNHDLKINGLPEARGIFVELLVNPKLVNQKILPNQWSEWKINEYGLARWNKLYTEMESQGRLFVVLPINESAQPAGVPTPNNKQSIWNWVMNNPMSAAVVGGIIALILGTIILKLVHLV